METNKHYYCKQCNWTGLEENLDEDKVETCFGDDSIEICPICGSTNVFPILQKEND